MEEKKELPIVGKVYWYCGKVGLSKNKSRFKFIQKPVEVKIHKIDSDYITISPLVNSSIFTNNCTRYLSTHEMGSWNYWEKWIFETKEEAMKGFNEKLDLLKELLWKEYDAIAAKIDEKKFSV